MPHAFLVLGSCANMIKGLSWMAGGSTRSVFNLSFVRDNNIAGAAGAAHGLQPDARRAAQPACAVLQLLYNAWFEGTRSRCDAHPTSTPT